MQGHRAVPAFPKLDPNTRVQGLSPRRGNVLAPHERFPRDFWLTPRTVLTRVTPISKLNHFCVRHGARGATQLTHLARPALPRPRPYRRVPSRPVGSGPPVHACD